MAVDSPKRHCVSRKDQGGFPSQLFSRAGRKARDVGCEAFLARRSGSLADAVTHACFTAVVRHNDPARHGVDSGG